MKVAIIIPTYNERDNIQELIKEIFKIHPQIEILIVDDNSPDGTGEVAEKLSREHKNTHVIHRPKKLGLSSAYTRGFRWALEGGFDYIFQMDADFAHRPMYISEMLEMAKAGADLVIGSRYKGGLRVKGWSFLRLSLSYIANCYARMALGLKIYDITSGFRCFNVDTLRMIDFSSIHSKGYAFQIEMVYLYWKKGYLIEESPITFFERKTGKSKLSIKQIIETFFTVMKLGLSRS